MKIIGGARRGLALASPADRAIRPTSARLREALFDRLEHAFALPDGRPAYAGAGVIDACCGVGALAMEALSRGAARAVLIDSSEIALRYARKNADAAGFSERCQFLRADVAQPPACAGPPAMLLFLDPPYGVVDPSAALTALAPWLGDQALAIVETAAKASLTPPPGYAPIDDRRYGAARAHILRRAVNAGSATCRN